jgi:hypothetical protein
MIGNTSDSGWATEVVKFMSENIPDRFEETGWDDWCSTAFQIGCKVLIALGQADGTNWGAIPRKCPELPNVLPRWDDICTAALYLAAQRNLLTYRLPDGSEYREPNPNYIISGKPPPPTPNILATDTLGSAYAKPEALAVLQALGLIAGGRWTDDAENVLWRVQPKAWDMDVTSDRRFIAAVQKAVDTLPEDIQSKIDRLLVISDEDVESARALEAAAIEKENNSVKDAPNALLGRPSTSAETRRSLIILRSGDLDWLFFQRWRLPDGWLSTDQAEHALEVFHDPLAIQMRRAVIERLHPDLTEFHK